jgi:hypothetical protein
MTFVLLVVLLVLAAAVLVALWCAWTATRLDRLHLRLASAEATLAEALARRCSYAAEAALAEGVDPATSVAILAAAGRARDAERGDWQAHGDLTTTLRAVGVLDSDQPLARSSRDVAINLAIHNDLAVRTAQLRARRRVRWFRLAGHAPDPEPVRLDA